MKGLLIQRRVAHAKAQFRRKAGGTDLTGAIGDGLQQHVLPLAEAIGPGQDQQRAHTLQCWSVQQGQPLGVKGARKTQGKELGRVVGLGRTRQQFVSQPFTEFADECRALGKSEVSQQGGGVHRCGQSGPPRQPAGLRLRVGLDGIKQQLQPRHGGGGRGAVAANPFEQADQPKMPLGQPGVRVKFCQQAGQVAW